MTNADIQNHCIMEETTQIESKKEDDSKSSNQTDKNPWELASDALKTLEEKESSSNNSNTPDNSMEKLGGIRNGYNQGNYPYINGYMGNSHGQYSAQFPPYGQYPQNNWYQGPQPGYRMPYQYPANYGMMPPPNSNPYGQNYPRYGNYGNIPYNNNNFPRPYGHQMNHQMNNGYYNNNQPFQPPPTGRFPQHQQNNSMGNKENNAGSVSGNITIVQNEDKSSNRETLNKPQSFADAVKNNKLWKQKAVANNNVFKCGQNLKPVWTQGSFQKLEKPQEDSNNIGGKRELTEGGTSVEPKLKQVKQETSPKMQEAKKKEWPDAMKDWVKTSFEQCEDERVKDKMEEKLKVFVNQVISDGTAWTLNWENKSLFEVPYKGKLERRKSQRRKSRSDSQSRSRSRSPVRKRSNNLSSSGSETSLDNVRTPVSTSLKGRIGKKQNTNKKKATAVKKQFKLPEDVATIRKKKDRAARFRKDFKKSSNCPAFPDTTVEEIDSDMMNFHINGYCKDLTKPYLRLTSAPDPATVRPQNVLEDSLLHVKDHWKKKQDYHYACEQMKSIRQDLTVQGIENEFTVKVYECHARIALEKGDREEFNQCQTCLRRLYNKGVSGQVAEFTAYNVLYYIYTKSNTDLNSCLSSLTKDLKKEEVVQHALAMRSACSLSNYRLFFKLYVTAPKMGGYLVDLFIDRERKEALKRMLKAYRPSLSISFISMQLAFESEDLCGTWLRELNLVFLPNEPSSIDCKASAAILT